MKMVVITCTRRELLSVVLVMVCVVNFIFFHRYHPMIMSEPRESSTDEVTLQDLSTNAPILSSVGSLQCGDITQHDVDFPLEENIQGGVLNIPGGGQIPCRSFDYNKRDKRVRRSTEYPFDLQGIHLHPALTFPNQSDVYFRIWPLKLTNINYDFDMMPSIVCPPRVTMVILVPSVSAYFYERHLIRETWGSVVGPDAKHWPGTDLSYPDFRLYFLIAQSKEVDEEVELKLSEEQELNQDLIRTTFVDSYRNLTLKSLMGLKFMKEHCSHVKHLLKTDDDIFLNVPQIASVAACSRDAKHAVIGGRWTGKVRRGWASKCGVHEERYPFKHFPPYLQGGVYLIPSQMYTELLDAAERIPPVPVEDAFITGIVRYTLNSTLIGESKMKVELRKDSHEQLREFVDGNKYVAVIQTLDNGREVWDAVEKAAIATKESNRNVSENLKYA